jgi:hypothetical protein
VLRSRRPRGASTISGLRVYGSDAIRWRLGDYGRTARALGRFNGAHITGRRLPVAAWLSRQWLRSWLAEGAAAGLAIDADVGGNSESATKPERPSWTDAQSDRRYRHDGRGVRASPSSFSCSVPRRGVSKRP